MSNLFWLSDEHMARLEPFLPRSHGKPRVDDRRVLNGIIFANRNGLRWSDAPNEYGPHKTPYDRWKRWSEMGVFGRVHPHMLRHSCGFALANKGRDLRLIQNYLGHRDPRHTAHYTRTAANRFDDQW